VRTTKDLQKRDQVRKVSATDLAVNLANHLKAAEDGESLLITEAGRPSALLVPYLPEESPDEKEGLAGLAGRWDDGDELADLLSSISHRRSSD
jgi:prevent-host-death family protein